MPRIGLVNGMPEVPMGADGRRSRFATAHTCVRTYLQLSTAHALRRVGWATRTPARIFWAILFLFVFISFFVLLILLVVEYNKYPVKLVEYTETSETLPFPAVTVCNMNAVKRSSLTPTQRTAIQNKVLNLVAPTVGGKGVSDQIEALAREQLAAGGDVSHSIKDMIAYCAFGGFVCHPEVEFKTYKHPKYGTCMTFNQDGQHLAREQGHYYGLRLMLYVDRGEDFGTMSATEGFRISIHAPGSQPYPDVSGFALATGLEAEATMNFVQMTRLSSPYGNCDEEALSSLECGEKTSDCAPPCNEVTYQLGISLTDWPSVNHNNSVQGLLSSFQGVEYDPSQLASVKVYYRSFMKYEIAEEPSISFSSLLSQAGGLSGLCIGFSLLTVLEFIEMVAHVCCGRIGNDEDPLVGDDQEQATEEVDPDATSLADPDNVENDDAEEFFA